VVLKKLSRALEEFGTYINNNAEGIVNYGELYRCGERISDSWSRPSTRSSRSASSKSSRCDGDLRGAHLLLQVRVHALDDDLHTAFQRWYPDLGHCREEKPAA
jgi:hypothetical protein